MCLRNPDAVPTTFALIDEVHLDQVDVLFEPRFVFRPDPLDPADSEAEKAAVLFGDPGSPYVRFDPYSAWTDRRAKRHDQLWTT